MSKDKKKHDRERTDGCAPGDRVAVVANDAKLDPAVGGALRQALADQGFDVAWTSIRKGSAATKATAAALEAGADRVVVAGGDGTVRAAIQAVARTEVPLAVVPAGTANLFAGALHLPTDPVEIAAAMRAGSVRHLDTARCNDLAFAIMAGTGLDAAMIDAADTAKERLGTLAYVRAGVREARQREPFEVKVTVDGDLLYEGSATCVLVANIGSLKGGVDAFPAASPDDGVLDVAVVTAAGLREWGSLMLSAVRRRQGASGHVHLARGARIKVRLEERHRFELDGGMKGRAKRLDVRVVPSSLWVVVNADQAQAATDRIADRVAARVDGAAAIGERVPVAPVSVTPAEAAEATPASI
jgi:YegS/Rv2252/BmrU family lipid kinase